MGDDSFDSDSGVQPEGPVDARYRAFLETITQLRPRLHRYCARMTGSVLDGEDVVQDALFLAYRKLETFDDAKPLAPWLFRIAHNRCIDFLRRRGVRQEAENEAMTPDWVAPIDPPGPALGHAVEQLVLSLPPKERACVLLKDVFDYSLDEIAELVDSTVGGVKAALSRGRAKLAATATSPTSPTASSTASTTASTTAPTPSASPEMSRLLDLYVERFNQRDWDGLRELIADDARLRVVDRFNGRMTDTPYFTRYADWKTPWRMSAAEIDGEPVMIMMVRGSDASSSGGDEWTPRSVVRFRIASHDGALRIEHVTDYNHCPWVVASAGSMVLSERAAR